MLSPKSLRSYTEAFWFPFNDPLRRSTFAHRSRLRKGRLAKSVILARRVIQSREKRGFARQNARHLFVKLNYMQSFFVRIIEYSLKEHKAQNVPLYAA